MKIAILELEDVLQGDCGAACYVLESLSRKTIGRTIHFSYLGDDPSFAGGLLYKTELAIIVGTLRLTGVPGGVHVWIRAILIVRTLSYPFVGTALNKYSQPWTICLANVRWRRELTAVG